MSKMNKLFRRKRPYNTLESNKIFFQAMKENCIYQYEHCQDYHRILDSKKFNPYIDLNCYEDIEKIPFIPTLYFKRHKLVSMSDKKMVIKASSSGNSGKKSFIGFNVSSLLRGFNMVKKVGRYHHLWSVKPTHYLIFGYEPNKNNPIAFSKTGYGFTYFAPALSRTYALKYRKSGYEVDLEGMKKALIKYSSGSFPVRTIGFPAYTYFLLKEMKEQGLKVTLPKGSLITLGGGWKQFYAEKVEKEDF